MLRKILFIIKLIQLLKNQLNEYKIINIYFSAASFIFSGIFAHSVTMSKTFDLVIVFLFEMGSSESICII